MLILGLSYGLILFLLATGLTLTMGLMRVVNLSHGALYMIAGYTAVMVYKQSNSWIAGVIAGAAIAALIGLMLEIVFLRRLYKNPTNQVLLTIGFVNIINNVTQWIWGAFPASIPVPKFVPGSVAVGVVNIPRVRFFIIGFGILMAVLLWLLQDKTKIGAIVRAGMDNSEIAATIGLNNKMIFTLVFVLGSMIAGLSSMFGGIITGIHMGTSWDVLLFSIIVVVVGGTGSIQGALLGGVIIGLVDAFGKAYFPAFSSFIMYAVLIIILLIKPAGLLGRKTDVNRAPESGGRDQGARQKRFRPEAAPPGSKMFWKLTAYRGAPYVLALVILAVLPLFLNTYMQSMTTKVLIFALFAISLDVIMGYTGMTSFGHAAFFGMGGYTAGVFAKQLGINSFWLLLLFTLAACALLSALIGYFTLRLSGVHFLLVTMAFAQLLSVVAVKWISVTNGSDGLFGIPRPNLGFSVSWTSGKMYYFVLIFFIICYFLLYRIMHSSFGQSLIGVRESEGRMRSQGYNTWALKYMGMIIAGVFAGIAGLLYASSYGTMAPANFALETSSLPMLMIIMGGGATLWGPVLGAAVIILVQNYAGVYFPERWPLILGTLYVLCVIFLRGGFARYLTGFWDSVGNRLFSKGGGSSLRVGDDAGEELES